MYECVNMWCQTENGIWIDVTKQTISSVIHYKYLALLLDLQHRLLWKAAEKVIANVFIVRCYFNLNQKFLEWILKWSATVFTAQLNMPTKIKKFMFHVNGILLLGWHNKKYPYTVIFIKSDDVIEFKEVKKQNLRNTKIDPSRPRINWLQIKRIHTREDNTERIFSKYNSTFMKSMYLLIRLNGDELIISSVFTFTDDAESTQQIATSLATFKNAKTGSR